MNTYPYEVATLELPAGRWVTTEKGEMVAKYPEDVLSKFDFEGELTNVIREYSDGSIERTWTQREDGYLIGRMAVVVYPPLP